MAHEPVVRVAVPESEIPSLKLLARTPSEDLQKLGTALRDEKPTLNPEPLAQSVAERTGISSEAVVPVLSVLWRLAIVQRRLGLSANALLQAVEASLRAVTDGRWTEEDGELLAARRGEIGRLLTEESALTSSAKAMELLLEQQLVFCNARILTDLRPVFDDRAQHVRALVPFHTLVVNCHEGSDTRSFHIAMDATDLTRLQELLVRAEQKEALLRELLAPLPVPVVATEAQQDASQ